MEHWRNLCAELRVIHDEAALFNAARDLALSLGFEAFVFALLIPTALHRPTFRVYGAHLGESDTMTTHTLRKIMRGSLTGGNWSTPGARKAAFWLDTLPKSMTHGWSQPTTGFGLELGMASFARSEKPLAGEELERLEVRMLYVAQTLHCQLMRLALERGELHDPLSAEELAVLRWAADGKTAKVIGKILNMPERSVIHRISRARFKMRATSTIQAAVRAQGFGLL